MADSLKIRWGGGSEHTRLYRHNKPRQDGFSAERREWEGNRRGHRRKFLEHPWYRILLVGEQLGAITAIGVGSAKLSVKVSKRRACQLSRRHIRRCRGGGSGVLDHVLSQGTERDTVQGLTGAESRWTVRVKREVGT